MNSQPDQSASRPRWRSRLRRALWPSWQQRKRLLRIEAWIFVILSYAVIGFACLWPVDFQNDSPAHVTGAYVAFMVRTFLFHLGLVLVVIAAVAVFARSWRLLAGALPLVLLTVGPLIWQYRPRSVPDPQGELVTVMSVNLLVVNKNTGPIIDEIAAVAPDILLLQEYTDPWHTALQSTIGADYPHVLYIRRNDSFGAAIYARRPFVEPAVAYLPLGDGDLPQMRAVVRVAGRDVAVYNIHLLPPYWGEYATDGRRQFADLLDHLANEPLPVIMAGDFNFTERSQQAEALARSGFDEAHDLAGWGRGTTWPVHGLFRWLPGLRLDHTYLSGSLTCTRCRTGTGQGSDHRPVVAVVGFAAQNGDRLGE